MAHAYRPRRASKRWLDSDCPSGVLAIFDHPKFADRYTVFYCEMVAPHVVGYRSMCANPTHPQGFGQWGEMTSDECRMYRYEQSHRAHRWSDLPDAVKAVVRSDLAVTQ